MCYISGCGRTRVLGHFSTNGLCADGGQEHYTLVYLIYTFSKNFHTAATLTEMALPGYSYFTYL